MRKLLAVLAGVAVLFLVVLGVEAAAHALPARLLRPTVAAGWFLGPLAGGAAALRIARWRPAAWIVAGLAVAAGLANLLSLPHPLWMQAAAVLLPVAAALAAERTAGRS